MSDYFNCKLCDKSIKKKFKKKQLNSQYHKSLSMSITYKSGFSSQRNYIKKLCSWL